MKKLHTEFVASFNDWTGALCVSLDDYEKLVDTLAEANKRAEDDAKRLAFAYFNNKTESNELINLQLRLIQGESVTLTEVRAAIDEAMKNA